MRLFAIFVLAPALSFNLYAMFRFWSEMQRAKPARGRAGRFLTTRFRRSEHDSPHEPHRFANELKTSGARGVVTFSSGSKKGAEPNRL
jgi:hypothetical protein